MSVSLDTPGMCRTHGGVVETTCVMAAPGIDERRGAEAVTGVLPKQGREGRRPWAVIIPRDRLNGVAEYQHRRSLAARGMGGYLL